ncbi:MAG TPA: glycosyltransferase [Nitrososphaeraceae archaeon]|nr:glycosyltransferase [Nitrososphaeraceae archaeon]
MSHIRTSEEITLIFIIAALSVLLIFSVIFVISPDFFNTISILEPIQLLVLKISEFFGYVAINYYQLIWIYLPLGVIGFWRWSVWLFKKSTSFLYKPKLSCDKVNYKYSIITPVYNEDPKIFEQAIKSWIRNEPDEIIGVIDESDNRCIEVFQSLANQYASLKLIIARKPGKRPALAEGIKEARNKIIALVDSDTIWAENIKKSILSPFEDPEIGGVTTRQHPIERKTIWQKVTDIFWDMRNYYDLPAQTAMGQALSCLSGRTSLYRKDIILGELDIFLNEIVLGRKKESGEDKCLTRIVQSKGWKTYYQSNAVIYSYASPDFKTFWSQRLRWSRNSHNSDLISLWDGWAWKHPFLAFHIIDRFISIFTLFFGPIFFGIALYLNHYVLAVSILLLWMIGRGIKILPHLKRQPEDIVLLPVYVVINFMIAIIKLYALVTIRDQKWIRSKNRKLVTSKFKKIKNFILTSEIIGSLIFIIIFVVR